MGGSLFQFHLRDRGARREEVFSFLRRKIAAKAVSFSKRETLGALRNERLAILETFDRFLMEYIFDDLSDFPASFVLFLAL